LKAIQRFELGVEERIEVNLETVLLVALAIIIFPAYLVILSAANYVGKILAIQWMFGNNKDNKEGKENHNNGEE